MSEETKATDAKTKRTVVGRVVSNKMSKSVTISIDRVIKHPAYGKYVRRSNKVMAHDANDDCQIGDLVAISECRPISKNKAWQVVEILEKAPAQQ